MGEARRVDAKHVARLVEPRLVEARASLRGYGDPDVADRVDVLRGVLEAARTGRARCPNCRRLLPGLKDKAVAMVEALRETTCHEVDPRGMAYDCL